jgi:uncharacterized protein
MTSRRLFLIGGGALLAGCNAEANLGENASVTPPPRAPDTRPEPVPVTFAEKVAARAVELTRSPEVYDPAYVRLAYPMGDVPAGRGVCADVVIRAFRAGGVDLQQDLHEDMSANFAAYPSRRVWGLARPDRNIDHRRVLNLEVFLRRKGAELPLSRLGNGGEARDGDLISCRLSNGLPHIAVVAGGPVRGTPRRFMVHNIGAGSRREDVMFRFQNVGWFRWPD